MKRPATASHVAGRRREGFERLPGMLTAALASLGDQTPPRWVLPGVLLFAVLIRALVSTHPHSGQGEPPMFGDYEAQRH